MTYTVVWAPSAEEKLAHLWLSARDRKALADAAAAIDAALRIDPLSEGESRSGSVRITIVDPLAVHFEVNEQDSRVRVLEVWRSKRGP